MKKLFAMLMAVVFCVSMLSFSSLAEPAPEGGSAGSQTEEFEITVDGVTAIAHYEDVDNGDQATKSFTITFDGKEYTGTIDRGVWTADDPAGQAVVEAFQAAHESDPSFQGAPPAGDSPEGESPEGESPEGESPEEAAPEGESPEGESPEEAAPEGESGSGEGESEGESASSGGSASPMQETILTDGAEETYENVTWSGEGGYLALLGATAHVGGEEDNYQVQGLMLPVTGKYFQASAVDFDGAVNSIFNGTQDATGGGATFNVTGEGSALYVDNAYITSQGSQTAAMYVDETNNKVVVQDSYLESKGTLEGYEDVTDFIALQGLLSWGHTRTNLSQGVSSTYYYNTAVIADGWAAMSTDGAQGLGVNFVAVNSYAETTDGGYAIYSDHECRDYVLGSTLVGAEYGAIIAAGGELYLLNGAGVDLDTVELNGWRAQAIEMLPEQELNLMETSYQDFAGEHPVYALEEYDGDPMEVGRSTIVGGRNCVLMHKPDEQHEGLPAATQNVLMASGTDFIVDRELFRLDDMPEGWYTPADVTSSASFFNDDTLNYVKFTSGPAILLRSCSAFVALDDVTFESNYDGEFGQAGTFLMSVINSDGNANLIPDGETASPDEILIMRSDIQGDIIDYDYQRAMNIRLDAASLTGAIEWHDVNDWNAIWGEGGTLGTGAYAYDEAYETQWGPSVKLTNGATWTVTRESHVRDLIVDTESSVIGIIEKTENGYTVYPEDGIEEIVPEESVPEGESPEGESPEGESPEGESPEGESPEGSAGGPGLQTEEYEITVGDVTGIAHYQDLESDSEKRAFVITFDGKDYSGKIDKGVWTADDPEGADVIAAYQAAHEADPSFQGPPPSAGGDSEGGDSPAEEAPAAGDTSEEAYHAYLKEFVDACPAVSDEHLADFFALIDASDYTTMPADMMFNDQWWGYAAMTYDEFVAANGAYEIPAFDPNLVPD